MTEGEPFSGSKSSPDDSSSQILRGDGETRSLDPAVIASSTILPARSTAPEHMVIIGGVSPTEQPEACNLGNDSKRGVKRAREIEPMDHSGSHHQDKVYIISPKHI